MRRCTRRWAKPTLRSRHVQNTPGINGQRQAPEALKLVLDIGEPRAGRVLHFDALGMRFRETGLPPDPDCPVCARGRAFPGYIDYEAFCSG